ncbi:Crp/Fnr family transcriptional regulator [Flammeovirgaceae bacterium SG7u.111]|nr:Crp/Fnr family transcriptional regulator [Flammeovirgaceae bacterium SG7u.132]WPO35003.1 Crp/Fnr family transcriptional regulator [Flammeovirgaceae bacterium SG7u.111]
MNILEKLKADIEEQRLWEKDLTLSRNEYLKVAGSVDTNMYFVVSGSLRIFVMDEYEEHTIRFGYQGSFFASLDSFIGELPSDYYIQAIKKTELKVMGKRQFMAFVHSSSENQELWNKILEQIISQQLERERDILTSSPIKRYKRVMERSPKLFQEIPHKYIASYLRMTPETLSRIKKS